MKPRRLPAWAEKVIDDLAPVPAFGELEPDEVALRRYTATVQRFRDRWHAELAPDVWPLFKGHAEPAKILLALMVDMARYGSRAKLAAKREALLEVERVDDEIVETLRTLKSKLAYRRELVNTHGIEDGFDSDLLHTLDDLVGDLPQWREITLRLRTASMPRPTVEDFVDALAGQPWHPPRLFDAEHADAISSRKTQRDALVAMLALLDRYEPELEPVKLTDAARAAVFNVAHDVAPADCYTAAAIKKARADLRKLR